MQPSRERPPHLLPLSRPLLRPSLLLGNQARLVALTQKQSFAIVESTQGNGIEAWMLLFQRFGAMADVRFAVLVSQIVGHKIANNSDVHSAIAAWEALVLSLDRISRV